MNKKIVLTGGHAATTALSVVQEIRSQSLDWEIFWIGNKYAIEGKKVETLESAIFPKNGVKVFNITSGRLQRKFTRFTIFSLFKIPVGFIQSFKLLRKIKPDIILSFGGGASFPVVFIGWVLGIPVVLHEQVASAGKANEFSTPFASKIILSRETSLEFYPKEKSVVLGNPIIESVKKVLTKTRPGNPKTIFITGGSRGSQTLNNLIEPILPRLLKEFKIIHLCGDIEYEKFSEIKKHLEKDFQGKYKLYKQVDPAKLLTFYQESDIIVARAGANTISEIIYVKRPAILIPIPWSYKDEQYKNALFAKDIGLAEIVDQDTANAEDLYKLLQKLSENWQLIIKNVDKRENLDIYASAKIVRLLEGLM